MAEFAKGGLFRLECGSRQHHPVCLSLQRDKTKVLIECYVKNLDWRARDATPKGKVSEENLNEVRSKIRA